MLRKKSKNARTLKWSNLYRKTKRSGKQRNVRDEKEKSMMPHNSAILATSSATSRP